MSSTRDLIRQLPDLDTLMERLEVAPAIDAPQAFTDGGSRSFEAAGFDEPVSFGMESFSLIAEIRDPEETTRERYLAAGARAVRKLKTEGLDADLRPDERIGLEAIVVTEGRPAILVQDGRFFPPPLKWQFLESSRETIEANCKSVGRIEVTGHPSLDWIGTGFLVADDVIMTNRHVAKEFCQMKSRKRWGFETGMMAHIDYVEEMGALNSAEFALTRVIGIHDVFDLALLRVERKSSSGLTRPKPLTISTTPPSQQQGCPVYCVGYPAWDGRRNDPDVMRKIFSNIFDVKRLQPGEIITVLDQEKLLLHDCSTLGGNSGSCVIDLESNQVVGLHFGGRYQQGNYAVALWQLVDDPLLKKAKLNFA